LEKSEKTKNKKDIKVFNSRACHAHAAGHAMGRGGLSRSHVLTLGAAQQYSWHYQR
jgi:hypothetical protein